MYKRQGLFDGHNSGGVSAAQELYENTLITDVHTAAKVYGNTEAVSYTHLDVYKRQR